MVEVWLDVRGYKGLYKVSNKGRIKSLERWVKTGRGGLQLKRERILKPTIAGNSRYKMVILCKGGRIKHRTVHRIVAETFIPNPDNKPVVNHKDFDTQNNWVNNLEWTTHKGNSQHSLKNGRFCTGAARAAKSAFKLTRRKAKQIKDRLQQGETGRAIASDLGISEALVSMIKHGKVWNH